jgi:radical SAM superfamily enzyme YgiQ (UPF0313 family)
MSNLGFHFLYGRLRRSPYVRTERLFSDTSPLTFESGRTASSAAVILFSVSYEEDCLNLVRMLVQSGIEPLRSRRGGAPVLIAGGPAAGANPFPLSVIVDAVVLGEGERPLDAIMRAIEDSPGIEKERFLGVISRIQGTFVPEAGRGQSRFAPNAGARELQRSVVVTRGTVFSDTVLIESSRGCPGACSFCLARSLYRPYRFLPAGDLERFITAVPIPVRKVGLVSTAVAAHPELDRIVRLLGGRGISTALSSLRAEDIDDEKAALIGRAGVRSASLAPESGSERLRSSMGKKVTDDRFFHAAAALRSAGVRNFSLYLLVGFPGEGEETMRETKHFLEGFRLALDGRQFSVHVNVVVPKAWTPLQFLPMPHRSDLDNRLRGVAKIARDLGLAVRVKSVRSALRQAALSIGDERVGNGVVRFVSGGVSWKRALEYEGLEEGFVHLPRGLETPVPWDAIQGPVDRALLLRRYRRISESI